MAEQRPVPMNPGEKATGISAPRNSLASMFARGMTASDIRNNAPESHRQMDRRMGIKTEDEVRALKAAGMDGPLRPPPIVSTGQLAKSVQLVKTRWQRGDQAQDTKHGKRVTILAARVKVNDEGIPYHRVAAGGEVWLAKDTKLKPVT